MLNVTIRRNSLVPESVTISMVIVVDFHKLYPDFIMLYFVAICEGMAIVPRTSVIANMK